MRQRLRQGRFKGGKNQARRLVFGSGQDEVCQALGLRSVQSDQVEEIAGRADEQGIDAGGAQTFPHPLAARRVIKWLVLHGDFSTFQPGREPWPVCVPPVSVVIPASPL